MKQEAYEVIDPEGPSETVLFTANRKGNFDSSGRFSTFFDTVHVPLIATSVDTYVWTNPEGVWEVSRAESIISVTGGTGADVMVEVCSGVTALTSGVDQLSAVLDLEETAPDKQVGTLIATPTSIFPGDNVSVYFTGTLTGLVGNLTITLKRTG